MIKTQYEQLDVNQARTWVANHYKLCHKASEVLNFLIKRKKCFGLNKKKINW